jgi:dolichol-phosphate mannosyltransferase
MLTIVLPAFNEAAGIGCLLQRLLETVRPTAPFQVLVVDDGSTDGTRAVVERMASTLPVRILRHRVNLGYGRALRTGLLEAVHAGGPVVTLDADQSHDPALITQMIEKIEAGHDLVIASRFRSGGAEVGVPWNRHLLSRMASMVFRSTLSIGDVRDYTSGYRAYDSSLLRRMIAARGQVGFLRSANFSAGFELLLNAASLRARVTEVPLVLRYDRKLSKSKMRLARDLPPYFSLLLRHRLQSVGLRR